MGLTPTLYEGSRDPECVEATRKDKKEIPRMTLPVCPARLPPVRSRTRQTR